MASPFSFHCIICIEEFDPKDRYPVVLPCGHTYVCNHCAERLTKCMECREPLLISDPSSIQPVLSYRPTAAGQAPSPDWSRGRPAQNRGPIARGQAPAPSSQQPPKKRLPLPKNVVLMSLMEATDVLTAPPAPEPGSPSAMHPDVHSAVSEEDEENEKIRWSTLLATSGCGTYVVTDPEGVQVYPSKPSSEDGSSVSPRASSPRSSENDDVDAMVRFFYLESKMPVLGRSPDDTSISELPAVRLSRGDRIQIVCMEDGWAKLARGYGYIRAGKGQIAKVGGSVDRACKLEALLRSVTLRRKELRIQQRKTDSQLVTMMQDLQTSLLNDEDLTVIGADTFSEVDMKVRFNNFMDEQEDRKIAAHDSDSDNSIAEGKGALVYKRADSPPSIVPQSSFGCFPEGMFGDFGGLSSRRQESSSSSQSEVVAGVMRALSFSDDRSTSDAQRASRRVLHQASSHPSPRAMSAGAQAWRDRNNRPASRGIDFRTGMSGHMALLSTQVHRDPHSYLRTNTSMLGKMSAHTGLTLTRKPASPNNQKRDDYDDSRTI